VRCFFSDDFPYDETAVAKNLSSPDAHNRLEALAEALLLLEDWEATSIEARLKETASKLGVKTGELVHPARVAVSGRSIGAGLYEMFEILGREKTIQRLLAGTH
jgi:glutamyl-tRNA synthetase